MSVGHHTNRDAALLRLLASQRAFRSWHCAHLDPAARRMLDRADRQTLMTIAAHALRRLVE